MAYIITDACVYCMEGCRVACKVGAIYYDGDKNVIDQSKCVGCGRCADACTVSAIINTDDPVVEPVPHEPVNYDCDLVVIGGGQSGLIGATRAAYLSGKRVIVLEKLKKTGGSGTYSAGCRPYASKWQKEKGIPDPTVDYVRAAMNTTVGVLNPQLVYNAYNAQNLFFDWYCEWGEPEKHYDWVQRPGDEYPSLMPKRYTEGGNLLMKQTYALAQKHGVQFLFETVAEEFIMEDGRVVGVKAKDPGGEVIVRAKACLVAAGGLINNKEVVARCCPDFADAYMTRSPHSRPSSSGDSIKLAEKAGIPIDYDNICVAFIGEMGGTEDPQISKLIIRPDVLKVNLNGERFHDEHAIREGASFALLKQPHCMAWRIMDTNIAERPFGESLPVLRDVNYGRMMFSALPNEDGSAKAPDALMTLGPTPPLRVNPDELDPPVVALEKAAQLKGKKVVRADTLEELAEQMEVPVDAFLKTVERYNELCRLGRDEDYFKHAEYMIPIEQGPFYAMKHYLNHDGCFGGYFINENMNVTRGEGGEPIPGLYASGDNTSSRFINRGYQRVEIINDSPWALGSGFTAGTAIAEYLQSLD